MTASAIQGDREKCLQSGMNNYLAKPVRAQTLKALLESYLSKQTDEKSEIPNLQAEATKIVKEVLREVDTSSSGSVTAAVKENGAANNVDLERVMGDLNVGEGDSGVKDGPAGGETPQGPPSRPTSLRTNTTQRWIPREGEEKESSPTK
jgi:hypothetical protein